MYTRKAGWQAAKSNDLYVYIVVDMVRVDHELYRWERK